MKNFYSPNFNKKKRLISSIKVVIIHYTGMQSERESIKRLCNPRYKVSSHFLINQNGNVYKLVNDNRIAWHAGKSCWGKLKNLNKNSIGIELVNKGHLLGYTSFKKKQLTSLIKICRQLIKKYKIRKENIIGHSDIAPLRKIDPGEKFPWDILAKNKIGVWHKYKGSFLKKFRNVQISKKSKLNFMKKINILGYCLRYKRYNEKYLIRKIVEAFQRHFRRELINGIIDKECLLIAENIAKKT